jgi:exosortase
VIPKVDDPRHVAADAHAVSAHLAALAAIGAALVFAYSAIGIRLVQQWRDDENYSHGFIVVPIAICFAWQRRHAALSAPRRPTAWGLSLVVASLGLLVVGTLGAELFLARLSLVGVVAGVVLFLFGPACLGALKVPLLFLLLAIPLPTIVLNAVTFPLQLVASRAGEALIRAAGVPVIREGNVIELASLRLEVVEACSGIRSMMALLTCACVVVCIRPTRAATAAVVIAATVPVAIATNALRVAIAGLAAQLAGPWAAEGFLHACSGTVLFLVGLCGLLALERSVRSLQRSRIAT